MTSHVCPKCNYQTEENEPFCPKCGTNLEKSHIDSIYRQQETQYGENRLSISRFLDALKALSTSVKLMVAVKLIALTIETGIEPATVLLFALLAAGLFGLHIGKNIYTDRERAVWSFLLKTIAFAGIYLGHSNSLYRWTGLISYVIIFILPLNTFTYLHQMWINLWSNRLPDDIARIDNQHNECEIIDAEIVDESDTKNDNNQTHP